MSSMLFFSHLWLAVNELREDKIMFDTTTTLKAHISLNVRDVQTSIDFYRELFAIEPSKVRTGYAKFDVATPPLNLTLNQNAATSGGGLSHLGIQVATTDAVNAIRGEWQRRGLLPRDEMQTTCCYALQDKAWVTDPDGNEWEVFTVIEDDLAEDSRETASTACCIPGFVGIGSKGTNAETNCR